MFGMKDVDLENAHAWVGRQHSAQSPNYKWMFETGGQKLGKNR